MEFNTWWSLDVEDATLLTDLDREHIAEMVLEGMTSGELINEPDEL